MGASLHALSFFGGLFAYAHALPGVLTTAGVNVEPWVPGAAYFGCLLLAAAVGAIVNHLYPDDEQLLHCKEERRRRAGRRRIPRLLSGATTLTGLLTSVQFAPAGAGLPTWPILVMAAFTALYTVLHWLRRHRQDEPVACSVNPESATTPEPPAAPEPGPAPPTRVRARVRRSGYVAREVRAHRNGIRIVA